MVRMHCVDDEETIEQSNAEGDKERHGWTVKTTASIHHVRILSVANSRRYCLLLPHISCARVSSLAGTTNWLGRRLNGIFNRKVSLFDQQ